MRARSLPALVAGLLVLCALAGCTSDSADGTTPATVASVPSTAGGPLRIGIQDDRLMHAEVDPGPRLDMVTDLRARLLRLDLRWDQVALRRPAKATDPKDPAYDWTHYDRVVDGARARGLTIIATVYGTPAWAADISHDAVAYGEAYATPFGNRPRHPTDAGDFAQAAAARYAPKGIHMWEAWNEPNIPLFLRPQWRREGRLWVPDSPRTYARILKAMYAGFKKADPDAVVAGGVTAPNGDVPDAQGGPACGGNLPANCRVTPQAFVRTLNAPDLRPPMDAYAHHPYPNRPPTDAVNPDATYIDLYSMPALENLLDAGYLRGKPIWVTEFGVATARVPNFPYWRTPELQKQYLNDAVTRVRANARITMFVWYFLQDNGEWASGLYDANGAAKPAVAAFRAAASGG